ncbi:MAG TPA: hypothetical protein VJ800_05995 [Pseudolabrys sp.]|nr:hypothetical protein [Pseudolabrys sp.]
MSRLSAADLFLDTAPYNAGATASDALWAGLPVLTCRCDVFVGRMAASLLSAIGLPELVTATPQAYEELTRELAAICRNVSAPSDGPSARSYPRRPIDSPRLRGVTRIMQPLEID